MIDITVKGKSYGEDEILGDIQFSIPKGRVVALLGPSGIGKSTLLRMIVGLDSDFQGQIQTPEKTAMVCQEPTLLPWRTAAQNIRLITGASDTQVSNALAMLEISEKADHYPQQLSLGQQRRLSLARAFASKPEFLVMDEPFTSLDENLVDEMLQVTKALIKRNRMTTLIVTHSKKEAEFLADDILALGGKPARLQ